MISNIDRIESLRLDENYVQLYLRIKKTPSPENRYLRFRNFLREEMASAYLHGHGDRTVINGEGYVVNVVRSAKYWHITIVCNKKLRAKMQTGLKFFDATKKLHTNM